MSQLHKLVIPGRTRDSRERTRNPGIPSPLHRPSPADTAQRIRAHELHHRRRSSPLRQARGLIDHRPDAAPPSSRSPTPASSVPTSTASCAAIPPPCRTSCWPPCSPSISASRRLTPMRSRSAVLPAGDDDAGASSGRGRRGRGAGGRGENRLTGKPRCARSRCWRRSGDPDYEGAAGPTIPPINGLVGSRYMHAHARPQEDLAESGGGRCAPTRRPIWRYIDDAHYGGRRGWRQTVAMPVKPLDRRPASDGARCRHQPARRYNRYRREGARERAVAAPTSMSRWVLAFRLEPAPQIGTRSYQQAACGIALTDARETPVYASIDDYAATPLEDLGTCRARRGGGAGAAGQFRTRRAMPLDTESGPAALRAICGARRAMVDLVEADPQMTVACRGSASARRP